MFLPNMFEEICLANLAHQGRVNMRMFGQSSRIASGRRPSAVARSSAALQGTNKQQVDCHVLAVSGGKSAPWCSFARVQCCIGLVYAQRLVSTIFNHRVRSGSFEDTAFEKISAQNCQQTEEALKCQALAASSEFSMTMSRAWPVLLVTSMSL